MLVSIQPVEAADIPAFARLQLEAFASHPRTPMMWRKGYTDQVYAYHESKTKESLRDPECRLIKAVDDETGAMVGVSEITFALNIETNRNQRPVGEDDSPPDNWPEGGNWEMRQWYKRNALALLRESFDGVPYIRAQPNPLHTIPSVNISSQWSTFSPSLLHIKLVGLVRSC